MSECIVPPVIRKTYKGGRRYMARYHWIRERGPIQPGLVVCHSCDNPACINFDHLWLGTQKQNLDDMRRKGRDIHRGPPTVIVDGQRRCTACGVVKPLADFGMTQLRHGKWYWRPRCKPCRAIQNREARNRRRA